MLVPRFAQREYSTAAPRPPRPAVGLRLTATPVCKQHSEPKPAVERGSSARRARRPTGPAALLQAEAGVATMSIVNPKPFLNDLTPSGVIVKENGAWSTRASC